VLLWFSSLAGNGNVPEVVEMFTSGGGGIKKASESSTSPEKEKEQPGYCLGRKFSSQEDFCNFGGKRWLEPGGL